MEKKQKQTFHINCLNNYYNLLVPSLSSLDPSALFVGLLYNSDGHIQALPLHQTRHHCCGVLWVHLKKCAYKKDLRNYTGILNLKHHYTELKLVDMVESTLEHFIGNIIRICKLV